MNLKAYISRGHGNAKGLAEKLRIHPSFLSQMISGDRAISPERCVLIEHATKGQVTRKDLRPDDWERIWPELSEKEGV